MCNGFCGNRVEARREGMIRIGFICKKDLKILPNHRVNLEKRSTYKITCLGLFIVKEDMKRDVWQILKI
jgi:hypothetical protein